MASPSALKMSFHLVPKDNRALADEIRKSAPEPSQHHLKNDGKLHENDEHNLKELLTRLYTAICNFRSYRGKAATPDKQIIAAWESFLEPIRALAEVQPHGHIISARMLLYLTNAFLASWQLSRKFTNSPASAKPIAMRCSFLIALDDALLSCLTHIWGQSDKRETFDWVFTNYAVEAHTIDARRCPDKNKRNRLQELAERDRFRAACITKPDDLTPDNGVRGHVFWKRAETDVASYPLHPDASRWCYDDHDKEDSDASLMWQVIGSDGPIREGYCYHLVDEDTGQDTWRERPALRRSRQFIFDVRTVAARNLARDRKRLAEVIMAKSPLPLELQCEVLSYLEDIPEPHPYLGQLDLAGIYQRFPDIGETKCDNCCPGRASRAADKMAKLTCPLKSITIWSLPLRAFHTLHQTSGGDWEFCRHNFCPGHHRDGSWILPEGLVEDHLGEILRSRCGPDTTLRSIGLGPLDPVELPSEQEDNARKARLFNRKYSGYDGDDAHEEALWKGIGGLADAMIHGRALIGLHPSGRTTTDSSWMCGRTRQEESCMRSALRRNHSYCRYC